jgi:hypothetical protein
VIAKLAIKSALTLGVLAVGAVPQALGAETHQPRSCNSDGVHVSYDTDFDASLKTHVISGVLVEQIDTECKGSVIDVAVYNEAATAVAEATPGIIDDSGSIELQFPSPLAAPEIGGISITIRSGSSTWAMP